ncbi:hypothetical protein [Rasiella rasia]
MLDQFYTGATANIDQRLVIFFFLFILTFQRHKSFA